MPVSAGILIYKKTGDDFFFLLSHPGGPYFKNKDAGNWGIPKGIIEPGEDMMNAAMREFTEETGLALPGIDFTGLPAVRYKNGKTLHSWALQVDDMDLNGFTSNTFEVEWPPRTGKMGTYPELDQLIFFELTLAKEKIHPVQLPLIDAVTNLFDR